MQVSFKTGTKRFEYNNVYRYQEYLVINKRWTERAFLFRDGSILWEMMGFSTYAEDGSAFSIDDIINQNGAYNLPGRINGEYPQGIDLFVETVKKIGIKKGVDIWEMPPPTQ